MSRKIIGLITDFGIKGSHYIAAMKGVILGINPDVNIIDISHEITPFSIIEASYVNKTICLHYPMDTVFITVVDPGVGGSREILAFKTKSNHYFVGPNNGIFPNTIELNDIIECVEIQNDQFFIKPVSKTFHGRDIMAPVGAYITNGVSLKEFGPKLDPINFFKYPITYNVFTEEGKINCTIQYIDSFGNITTNIPIKNDSMEGINYPLNEKTPINVNVKEKKLKGKYSTHFSKFPKGTLMFLKGSTNYLEMSINQGNAAQTYNLRVGDVLKFTFKRK